MKLRSKEIDLIKDVPLRQKRRKMEASFYMVLAIALLLDLSTVRLVADRLDPIILGFAMAWAIASFVGAFWSNAREERLAELLLRFVNSDASAREQIAASNADEDEAGDDTAVTGKSGTS